MNSDAIRRTIYLSPIKDRDIVEYIDKNSERYTFSSVIKGLVRDGIKFRIKSLDQTIDVLQSNTNNLKNLVFNKKEIKDDDLERRLDDF